MKKAEICSLDWKTVLRMKISKKFAQVLLLATMMLYSLTVLWPFGYPCLYIWILWCVLSVIFLYVYVIFYICIFPFYIQSNLLFNLPEILTLFGSLHSLLCGQRPGLSDILHCISYLVSVFGLCPHVNSKMMHEFFTKRFASLE